MALADSHLKELVAREILNIFKTQRSAAGHCITANVIVALSNKRNWSTDEILGGIEYGLCEGWFENGPKFTLRLTTLGLNQIEAMIAAKILLHNPSGQRLIPRAVIRHAEDFAEGR